MSHKRKLVVFRSKDELEARAAGYPCLVNYDPFTKTGEYDDGVGHTSTVTFAVAANTAELKKLPKGEFGIVELEDAAAYSDLFEG